MEAKVMNYQCPACTGPLHFSGETGKLECEYCGNTFDTETIEMLNEDKEREAKAAVGAQEIQWNIDGAGSAWEEQETEGLKTYRCPSCGAEIVCDENTAATSCLYCGNPSVIPGQLGGMLKPDYVIPFKLEKKDAVEELKRYYKGKKFLPKAFKEQNHLEEIKGVYVPFWLFDGEADADMVFLGTRSRIYTVGDTEVTETDHYRVARKGKIRVENVPVDGSTKMPDEHMDAIEPFDYSEMKPFSTAYLPGKLADKYDVTAEQSAQRADERLRSSAESALRSTVIGYESLIPQYEDIQLEHGKVDYALLPVWMLHTKWQGRSFLFAMNGQTGKMVGDLPVSKGKVVAWLAGISLPLMAILGVLLFGL